MDHSVKICLENIRFWASSMIMLLGSCFCDCSHHLLESNVLTFLWLSHRCWVMAFWFCSLSLGLMLIIFLWRFQSCWVMILWVAPSLLGRLWSLSFGIPHHFGVDVWSLSYDFSHHVWGHDFMTCSHHFWGRRWSLAYDVSHQLWGMILWLFPSLVGLISIIFPWHFPSCCGSWF